MESGLQPQWRKLKRANDGVENDSNGVSRILRGVWHGDRSRGGGAQVLNRHRE